MKTYVESWLLYRKTHKSKFTVPSFLAAATIRPASTQASDFIRSDFVIDGEMRVTGAAAGAVAGAAAGAVAGAVAGAALKTPCGVDETLLDM